MSTYRIPILGPGTNPDASGSVWMEPASIAGVNDLTARLIVRFADTATKIGLHGGFVVPKNYVANAKVVFHWDGLANTGNVQWDFDYRNVAAAATLDPSTWQESVNSGAVAAPGTTLQLKETVITLTAANFSVDAEVLFIASRDGASGNDTMAADARLFALLFEYTDV